MAERRRARRTARRAVIRQAVKLANKARKRHGLCECDVDLRRCASQAEADADNSPAQVCAVCGKNMARIVLVQRSESNG